MSVGVATFNSIVGIPPTYQSAFTSLSACFLGSAMAAIGLGEGVQMAARIFLNMETTSYYT